jgi:HSP20 family protein
MRNDVFGIFDRLFDDTIGMFNFLPQQTAPRQLRELTSGSFPPATIKINPDKSYQVDIALAGVPEDVIDVSLQGEYITLTVDLERNKKAESTEEGDKEEKKEQPYVLQQGIRSFTYLQNSYLLPKQFDREKLTAVYKNGLLSITVPLKEEQAKLAEKRTVKLITE